MRSNGFSSLRYPTRAFRSPLLQEWRAAGDARFGRVRPLRYRSHGGRHHIGLSITIPSLRRVSNPIRPARLDTSRVRLRWQGIRIAGRTCHLAAGSIVLAGDIPPGQAQQREGTWTGRHLTVLHEASPAG